MHFQWISEIGIEAFIFFHLEKELSNEIPCSSLLSTNRTRFTILQYSSKDFPLRQSKIKEQGKKSAE